MAYAALASLARAVDLILPQDQNYAFLCTKEQMKSIHKCIIFLQELLEDYSLDTLESQITHVVYQLEDIIESIICRSLGQELGSRGQTHLPVRNVFFSLLEKLNVILQDATKMKKASLGDKDKSVKHYPLTTKGTPKVGLDDDLIQILDQIIGQELSKLKIIPITGMGGIGKTTLARAVYENTETVNHFDVRVWVTVSGEFRIEDILRRLLPEKQQTEVPNNRMVDFVYKRLIGRRYLVVLDDMWDNEVWDEVRRAFPCGNNDSCIILTTRLLGVANYIGASSVQVHEMKLLNEDQSWDLLRQKVYETETCSAGFEDIGRTISRNCKGLPLALVVIGGLLKFNMTIEYWEEVAKNTNEEAASDYDKLFGILSLSYTKLPRHLKACFLYMGAFPEDYAIPTEELVMIWSAEGFLKKPRESKRVEEVAEECLEELVERSLVLVTKRKYNGKIKTSSVHDVLREVCLRNAQEDKFLHYFTAEDMNEIAFREIIEVQRRVSFSTHKLLNFPSDTYDTFARSVLIKCPMNSSHNLLIEMYSQCPSIILRFQLLRVLDRVYIGDASSLSTLFKLTNLRYLHFVHKKSYPSLNVPESISNLQNLETLIFSGSYNGELLIPLEIWKMPRLRHLILTRKCNLPFPVLHQGYPILESLQTLSWITNFYFNESVIKKIPNIRKLSLEYKVFTIDDMKYFHLDDLVHLHRLEKLAICGETCRPQIRNYAFPLNLKKLTLQETKIPWRNMSIVGSLPHLEKLKLKWYSVTGEKWVPNKGEFVRLKYLKMEKLLIKQWIVESKHFPCLETLIIELCITLEEVPFGIGEIDSLQKLILKNCKEAEESVVAIREDRLNYGDTVLQVEISRDSYVPDVLYDPDDPDLWL